MYTTHFALCHSWGAAKCQTAEGSGGVGGNQVWNGLSSQVFIRGGATPALGSWDARVEERGEMYAGGGGGRPRGRTAGGGDSFPLWRVWLGCRRSCQMWVTAEERERWDGSRHRSQRDATCCLWQGRLRSHQLLSNSVGREIYPEFGLEREKQNANARMQFVIMNWKRESKSSGNNC